MRTIVDRAADFVLAVERVFGERPRVLDGSRAVQLRDVRLSLEAGERELCLIRMHGALAESSNELLDTIARSVGAEHIPREIKVDARLDVNAPTARSGEVGAE